ncbi:MAG: XRE family transcriptional regulator [Spirochaetes bacterium]|nr:MAG: XRE family transcriptional regulator [Spirochaetota bacterium]
MKIKDYIRQSGESQAAFARKVGVSPAAICRYVLGQRVPRPKIIEAIRQATDDAVTVCDFY